MRALIGFWLLKWNLYTAGRYDVTKVFDRVLAYKGLKTVTIITSYVYGNVKSMRRMENQKNNPQPQPRFSAS